MRVDRVLIVVAALLSALLGSLLFGFRYLPMVDLPQHAAQLSSWVHLDDPRFGFREQFTVNFRTPYLLAYVLARPFVPLLGVLGALKLVIFLAANATFAAYLYLLRSVEQDPWLSLLAFPLTFGFSFYFGFINFLLATPLVIVAVALALRYGREPTVRGGLRLAFVLALSFLTHALAFAAALGAAFLITLGEGRGEARKLSVYFPFALGPMLILPWLPGFLQSGSTSQHPEQWLLSLGRILDLPGALLALGSTDGIATGFAICLVVLLVLTLGGRARAPQRWVLLALAVGLYLFFPFELRGVSFLHPRFAALVVPGAIFAAQGSEPWLRAGLRRPLLALLCALWLGLFGLRLHVFNIEAQSFDEATRDLPMRLRVRPIIVNRATEGFPGVPAFLHFAAYYQAEKGGYLGYSFGRYFTNFVHYLPGVDIGMAEDQEWNPQLFDARREVSKYDCFIVRMDRDVGRILFARSPRKVSLVAQAGMFWVYRTE